MNLRPTRRRVSGSLLPHQPPTLTSPRLVTITADPATRYIDLDPGEDCLITATEPIAFTDGGFQDLTDAVVTVVGGRHVIAQGLEFTLDGGPITTLSAAVDGTQLTLDVASTAGFPSAGLLRIEGELIRYTAKTATGFTLDARNAGFYNGTTPGDYSHPAGATVYLGEYARSALSFRAQQGDVFAEGIYVHGFVNDGIRLSNVVGTVTLQNLLIGPVTCHDTEGMTDGHPDAVQVWLGGPAELRIAHATLLAGVKGRGLINEPSGTATGRIDLCDVEVVDTEDANNSLILGDGRAVDDAGTDTPWEVRNGWMRTRKARTVAGNVTGSVAALFDMDAIDASTGDLITPELWQGGYTSPGYL